MISILKVLILGGTSFLGPHLVQELQQQGHDVTIFTRGKHDCKFANVEVLRGDRDGDLGALLNREWDAVIDTSGYLPRLVKDSSELLMNATKHYTFISTISVYRDFHKLKIDESYPVAQLEDVKDEEITEKNYGALKAACEGVIQNYFPDRFLIVRPGIIVGPLDPTNRFSYWPLRIKRGGEILAPGSPGQLLQFIDVRDLAKWIVAMIERQATGIYNATGPAEPIAFEQLLCECQRGSGCDSKFTWVDEDFLIEQQVEDFVDLPLWISFKRNMPGFFNISIEKALQAGLRFRTVSETIQAIIDEDRGKDTVKINKNQKRMDFEKECSLLRRWREECRDR